MATTIKLQRLHPAAIRPLHTQGFDVSNATDLFTHSTVEVRPGETWMVPTGWAVALPYGWVWLIIPRSGLSYRTKARVPNAPGLIDHSYRGEIRVLIENTGTESIRFNAGDRIAQALMVKAEEQVFQEVAELPESNRVGGFGSTGR